MSSAKVYYISGFYRKGKEKIKFGKYVRALKKEDALEEVYSLLGSKHGVKRTLIYINNHDIRELINPDEIKDPVVKAFVENDSLILPAKK